MILNRAEVVPTACTAERRVQVRRAPAQLDPIFGLVAAHKAAWAALMELDDRDHKMFEESERAADAAMYELMNTPPKTLAGMRFIIQYLVNWDNNAGYHYLPTLLRSPLLAG
jgi:hypothetical protein